jgi:hypothetical protein
MKIEPQNPAPTSSNKLAGKGRLIATAAMFLIVIFLWRDQAKMKADLLGVSEQKNQLSEQNIKLEKALKTAHTDLAHFKVSIPQQSLKNQDQKEPAKETPAEYPETLILQPPQISQTADGLSARISFESTLNEPPGLLALVVRLPSASEAMIQGFKPVDETAFTDIKFRINESGRFAIFQGNPIHLNALEFDLTVSAPVKATVRGTEGIKPFEIDIAADSSKVRKL